MSKILSFLGPIEDRGETNGGGHRTIQPLNTLVQLIQIVVVLKFISDYN